MATKTFEVPRNASYSKDHADYYQNKENGWLGKNSSTIFQGKRQKDLFLFAYAIGKNRGSKSIFKPNERRSNVSVEAMTNEEKWCIVASGIEETGDILCLDDQKSVYEDAEEYAKEGIEIIKSHMERYGPNYPKQLELELKEILGAL
ncbi:hypothetical protein AZH53_09795 [Methanomicrobiaceae archaeon CYW5]|uniref:hypothetical protein n=1 Tax=Methanovulcanius yangii TaxID=1789227 RepID=UPI0029CA152E|nr:hypothetical protein [Methanovulcanius yangii]MBT8508696.1 hypothetical protein [Methanovulcanius yangii]